MDKIKEKIKELKNKSGVYLMKDAENKVIYVGKAKDLKNRLSQYFYKDVAQMDIKTRVFIKKIKELETIITESEKEALILESNLIKKYKPKYNVVLKDDKRYPLIKINLVDYPFPRVEIARQIKNDSNLYFGPFSSSLSVRRTLKFIDKHFKLPKCKKKKFVDKGSFCMNYQIGICFAPCSFDVDKSCFDEIVREISLFLKGKSTLLVKNLKEQMSNAAQKEDFEKAILFREKIFAIEATLERQRVVSNKEKDKDVICLKEYQNSFFIIILYIRSGFLNESFYQKLEYKNFDSSFVLNEFIKQYYAKGYFIPDEIIISEEIEDNKIIEDWLNEKKEKKVKITAAKRGEKKALIKMAEDNLSSRAKEDILLQEKKSSILRNLKRSLSLKKMPNLIECFDNSHISGTNSVSAKVVFKNGMPFKSLYRKYKIKTIFKEDDYGYMSEVFLRRFERLKKEGQIPDLIIVDGGKGQLNIAFNLAKQFNLLDEIDIISIAKKDIKKGETEDKIFKAQRKNPIKIGKDLLHFIENIRDEAHRFAISFHRQKRRDELKKSVLDEISGVGSKIKKRLLLSFKSIGAIKDATVEDISKRANIGDSLAKKIKERLEKND